MKKFFSSMLLLLTLLFSMTFPAAASEITVEQKVEQLVAECKESGAVTEYDMALWFHDWLTHHADYDETLTDYGADGVLLKGKGVCQSYSTAYALLLNLVGIENMIVAAPEMDHAWNIAKINGSWTHIDCTWDDPVSGCEPGDLARMGMENHQYFGLSDADMAKDHTWDRGSYPECFTILRELSQASLPAPYSLMKQVAGMDFSLIDSSDRTLTRKDFATGNTLLVFGRPTCPNTMWFVNEIIPWKDVLEKNQLHVIIVFENAEQVAESAAELPFTCAYEADGGMENWKFNTRINLAGAYMFPQLVLQNAQGYAFYYSTGFVEEPECVLATALQKLPETDDVSEGHTHTWSSWETVTKATVFAPESQKRTCSKCGESETRTYGKKLKSALTLSANSLNLKVKQQTTAIKVSKMANGDSVRSVTSSDSKVLKVLKYTKSGSITLKAGSKTGTAELTVRLYGGAAKTIKVKVQKETVKTTKISGLSKKLMVKKGAKKTLKPVITPITSQQKVTYASSKRKVASVSAKGVVTGKKKGKAKITVKSGNVKFVITVNVK